MSAPKPIGIPVLRRLAAVMLGLATLGVAAAGALTVVLHLHAMTVLTGSMKPTYGPGAVIITRSVPTRTVRPGMIVVVVPPGETSPFAHRVTSVSGRGMHPTITTKGDANPAADRWHVTIGASTVPKFVGEVPAVGRIPLALHSPRGRAFAFAALGLIISLFGAGQLFVFARRLDTAPAQPPTGSVG